MTGKIIRSHRERVKQANETLAHNPKYMDLPITVFDREAFVEFYLLEDIRNLYEKKLNDEENYVPEGRIDEMAKKRNIAKFTAIVNVFKAAVGAARAAIDSCEYTRVRKAIHESSLMIAARSVKYLPELKNMAIELLRSLSDDALFAQENEDAVHTAADELEAHEENVRAVKELPPTAEIIEEVIRAVEEAIPDKKIAAKQNPNA